MMTINPTCENNIKDVDNDNKVTTNAHNKRREQRYFSGTQPHYIIAMKNNRSKQQQQKTPLLP